MSLRAGMLSLLAALAVTSPVGAWWSYGPEFAPDPLEPGDEVMLVEGRGYPVLCAGSRDDWVAFVRSSRRSRTEADRMLQDGRIYRVPAGTRAFVMAPSSLLPGVNLSQGNHAGKSCFTDRSAMRLLRAYPRDGWGYPYPYPRG